MKPVSAQSRAWVRVPVWAKENGVPENPTISTTVEMAFTTDKTTPLVWNAASWEVDLGPDPDIFYARCLVGPSGVITLNSGEKYWVAVKISGAGVAPEQPVVWANTRLEVEP